MSAEKPPAEQDSMMSSMSLPDLGVDIANLVQGVMQANLRAMQELSRVTTPQGLLELQRRFAVEYIAALQQGTMDLVNALNAR